MSSVHKLIYHCKSAKYKVTSVICINKARYRYWPFLWGQHMQRHFFRYVAIYIQPISIVVNCLVHYGLCIIKY